MNGLDLFSGIGGISLALREWVRPIAYCERDKFCQAVLLSRMQSGELDTAPIWDDVTTFNKDLLQSKIDIIYGGFPCQDISVAGNGAGLAGERSGLYWELYRIVKETKPTFVFLENVPAIRTRGGIEVAKSLASIGYDCRWDVISAREVGAPFLGERWFLVAAANSETLRIKQRGRIGEGWSRAPLNTSTSNTRLTPWTPERGFESRVFGVGNGIPFAVDRDRCLGNAVVPEQAKTAFKKLLGIESDDSG